VTQDNLLLHMQQKVVVESSVENEKATNPEVRRREFQFCGLTRESLAQKVGKLCEAFHAAILRTFTTITLVAANRPVAGIGKFSGVSQHFSEMLFRPRASPGVHIA
jgi:hypothetical protein